MIKNKYQQIVKRKQLHFDIKINDHNNLKQRFMILTS